MFPFVPTLWSGDLSGLWGPSLQDVSIWFYGGLLGEMFHDRFHEPGTLAALPPGFASSGSLTGRGRMSSLLTQAPKSFYSLCGPAGLGYRGI